MKSEKNRVKERKTEKNEVIEKYLKKFCEKY